MKFYSPLRIYGVFTFLLTIFLVIKKRKSIYGLKPLKPKKLKQTILKLGTSFIKLAQVLATRADFFSQEYLDELKSLHDQIPPMNQKSFEKVFKDAFKSKNCFLRFDTIPIASASIGQVHMAYLTENKKVAVKLRRKGVKEQVLADINIITFFNKLFSPLFSFYTKNSIDNVISEFSTMIKQEINLTTELHNLQKFSNVYKNANIIFPKPYIELSSDDALVMSYEEGFRFDDKKNIFKHKIDFNTIISNLVSFYVEQMLINGYFHADPHPGNILITQESKIIFLDFGMVKTIPTNTRIAIIELIKSANEQDYESYINANKKLGTISYEAPVDELAQFTSKMFEIFANDNLSSESMQKLAFEVLETTRDFPFKLPSDAIYILRVSAIVEGLGTTYIENFNGIKDILPILQKNLPRALGSKENITENIFDYIKEIPQIFQGIKSIIKKSDDGNLQFEIAHSQLDYFSKEIKTFLNGKIYGLGFILSSFFLLGIQDSNYHPFTIILFIIGLYKFMKPN